jgi:tetratricopeptide (TPR) repeat protein
MWPFGKKKEEEATPLPEKKGPSSNARADLLWKAGSRYLARKQYLKAIASLQEAYEIEPSRLEGRLNLGAALYLAQQPAEALGHLKYVLAFEPKNTIALLNVAAIYDALGMLDESIQTLETLVGDRPNWADANYNLAVAYMKQDRLDDAHAALRRELTLNPKHDAARTLLNEVHLKPRKRQPEPDAKE